MTDTMKAVRVERYGGPEVLALTDVPRPRPAPTEILVRVRAAGINPVDWKTCAGGAIAGVLGDPPFVLGWDVAGVVEAIGFGVTRFAPGDRVFGMPRFPREAGCYAEYVVGPSRHFARVPDGLSDPEAAALPLVGLTAWQTLVDTARIGPGQTVLIHGAAGGVGHASVQLAKARGARVIGTARAGKHALLRDLGVDVLVDYTTQRFEDVARDVDVVLDLVGEYGERSLESLRPGGLLVAVAGPDPTLLERAAAAGRRATMFLVEPDGNALDQVAALVAAGELHPVVDQTFPLAEAAKAHEVGAHNRTAGKLVLTVG